MLPDGNMQALPSNGSDAGFRQDLSGQGRGAHLQSVSVTSADYGT